ncbi:hypothetical protein AJ80_02898 [Polytolypa hystricis UAMH7299]|uniref:DAGKc domain-containing protein n=1 Tax=Polytolypa hystricis (strain UAMH7299) TaxID=1447883 RepID=A0A2B7YPS0_POLH7|nr:hypothetical protein AJ80_02898 [Polytolypa hystricis UAMH7299]
MASKSTGTIDGKQVIFELTDDSLEWEDQKDGTRDSIPLDHIIGIIPSAGGQHHDDDDDDENSTATLLLLEENPAKADAEQPTLATRDASGLPGSLIKTKYVAPLPPHLQPSDPTNNCLEIHVVISTLSGTHGALRFFESALRPLLSHINVTQYQTHETKSSRTIIELTQSIFLPRAKSELPSTVILLSGDGGLIDMIKVISAAENIDDETFVPPTICLIPMGTGNATFNSTSFLDADSTFGLSKLLRGTASHLPVFQVALSPGSAYVTDEGRGREPVCEGHSSSERVVEAEIYGAVVVSWGMHASLVADSDTAEYRKHGADRFKMAATELLYPSDGSETHQYKGKVTFVRRDGGGELYEEVMDRRSHMYVLITQVSHLEKGFMVSPASRPLDGQLRLVHFGPLPPDRAMGLMGLAYQGGKHVQEEEVGYEAVETVKLQQEEEDERWRRICIDGKIVVIEKGGWVEVRSCQRQLLRLVV